MKKDNIETKARQLKVIFENISEAHDAIMSGKDVTAGGDEAKGILHSKPVIKMLRNCNTNPEAPKKDREVFTMLISINREEEFVLFPGCFSPGWHKEYECFTADIAQSGTSLPPGEGITWYGSTLFYHRFSYLPGHPGKITSTDFDYREITTAEFIIKSLHSQLFQVILNEPGALKSSFSTLNKNWGKDIRTRWDGSRIPGLLVYKKQQELEHFLTIDRESLELSAAKKKLRKENKRKLSGVLSGLLDHYLVLFTHLSRLDSGFILERKPNEEASRYLNDLSTDLKKLKVPRAANDLLGTVGQFIQTKPSSWFEWLLQAALLYLVKAYLILRNPDLQDLFSVLVRKMDLQSGRFTDVMPLQNVRITPICLLNELKGLAVSRFQLTSFPTLEDLKGKKFDKEVMEKLGKMIQDYPKALKDSRQMIQKCYLRCIQKMLEDTVLTERKHVETYQKAEIAKDSTWRFCHVTPEVIYDDDRFKGFPSLLGRSAPMRIIFERIIRAANSDHTVLISSRNGTGKELVAKALRHVNPQRKEGEFIDIDCASIPENLLESELFGFAPNSGVSGAPPEGRSSKFELADGGVLFLDEIGEMRLDLQAKLLRVLQEREFRRVGGNKLIDVDVLIIAATNRDLKSMVSKGTFREDLYYRLNVLPISIPTLRERQEDIPLLFNYFIQREKKLGNGRAIRTISRKALILLMNSSWPGNVRELENCARRIIALYIDPGAESIEPEDVLRFFEEEGTPLGETAVEAPRMISQSAFEKELPVDVPVSFRSSSQFILNIDTEVKNWLERMESGDVRSHLDIIDHYEQAGREVYKKLFESIMEGKKLNKYLEKVGMHDQYRAIRNKLHNIRKELEREEV